MKKILIVLCLLFSIAIADTASTPSKISSFIDKLPQIEDIECTFKQEKYLKGAMAPITSEGNFKFVKGQGVWFETLKPFHQSVTYSDKNYKQINDIMNAIANKKYEPLESQFNFFFEQKGETWYLTLKPKEYTSSYDIIDDIEIVGKQKINKIEIDLENGNKTVIWFQTK